MLSIFSKFPLSGLGRHLSRLVGFTRVELTEGSMALLKLLRGERVYKPPFWEPWFDMWGFFRKRYGDPGDVKNHIKMAKDLGMAALCIGYVDYLGGLRRYEATRSGAVRYAGGCLTSLEQLRGLKPPDWGELVERWRARREAIRRAGLLTWVVLPWCFHAVATAMGHANFFVKLYRDYEFVDGALEWVEEMNREAINTLVREVKPDLVLFDGDCAYKSGLMVSPELLRKLVFDRTRETVSYLRRMGVPYAFHSDGRLYDLIPMLVELGFSMVHGCEKAANDLGYLVERFGDNIVLAGNMDVAFLAMATPEEVRRETVRTLTIGSSKGKFVASCNTSPQDYIPEENYLAFVEAIRGFKPPEHASEAGR